MKTKWIIKTNDRGQQTYRGEKGGFEEWSTYDKHGNLTFFEQSNGNWFYYEYEGKVMVYKESQNGSIQRYDLAGKQIYHRTGIFISDDGKLTGGGEWRYSYNGTEVSRDYLGDINH